MVDAKPAFRIPIDDECRRWSDGHSHDLLHPPYQPPPEFRCAMYIQPREGKVFPTPSSCSALQKNVRETRDRNRRRGHRSSGISQMLPISPRHAILLYVHLTFDDQAMTFALLCSPPLVSIELLQMIFAMLIRLELRACRLWASFGETRCAESPCTRGARLSWAGA